MKKIFMAILASALFGMAFADSAKVVSVEGKVEVSRGGAWRALTANATVSEGDVIATGFKSSAVLSYHGSLMHLSALTRVTLEQLKQNEMKDSVSVFLNTGLVKSTVKPTGNKRVSYTVRNPIAVASVRGTDFTFTSNGAISCNEGAIATYPSAWYDPTAENTPAEGTSNATTPTTDVASNAPASSTLVLAGQGVSYDTTAGLTNAPLDSAVSNANAIATASASPLENETVTMGGVVASSGESPLPLPPPTPAPTTSSLNIGVTVGN